MQMEKTRRGFNEQIGGSRRKKNTNNKSQNGGESKARISLAAS